MIKLETYSQHPHRNELHLRYFGMNFAEFFKTPNLWTGDPVKIEDIGMTPLILMYFIVILWDGSKSMVLTNFMVLISFYTPLKTSENIWFSDDFRGKQKSSDMKWINGLDVVLNVFKVENKDTRPKSLENCRSKFLLNFPLV